MPIISATAEVDLPKWYQFIAKLLLLWREPAVPIVVIQGRHASSGQIHHKFHAPGELIQRRSDCGGRFLLKEWWPLPSTADKFTHFFTHLCHGFYRRALPDLTLLFVVDLYWYKKAVIQKARA